MWLVMPGIKRSDYNVQNTTFALIIMVQYVLRMYLVVPLSNQIIKAAGVVTKSAWGGAAYILLLYMLASHVWSSHLSPSDFMYKIPTQAFLKKVIGKILWLMFACNSYALFFSHNQEEIVSASYAMKNSIP